MRGSGGTPAADRAPPHDHTSAGTPADGRAPPNDRSQSPDRTGDTSTTGQDPPRAGPDPPGGSPSPATEDPEQVYYDRDGNQLPF